MKKLTRSLLAASLALSVGAGGLAPSLAAPLPALSSAPPAATLPLVDAQFVQELRRGQPGIDRRDMRRDWQRDRGPARDDRRFHRRGDHYYYNGHRGFRHRQPGYRYYNGWWFPPAAFIAGAIIGGAMNQAPAVSGSAHVRWCYERYRSYRASDNTFQPYSGPRRQCRSPYG